MIQEIYESDYIEMGSNSNVNSGGTNDSAEHLSPEHTVKHAWRDIVEYCRSFDEGQTANNS